VNRTRNQVSRNGSPFLFYQINYGSVMGELEGPELTFRQITGCAAAMTSQVLLTKQ